MGSFKILVLFIALCAALVFADDIEARFLPEYLYEQYNYVPINPSYPLSDGRLTRNEDRGQHSGHYESYPGNLQDNERNWEYNNYYHNSRNTEQHQEDIERRRPFYPIVPHVPLYPYNPLHSNGDSESIEALANRNYNAPSYRNIQGNENTDENEGNVVFRGNYYRGPNNQHFPLTSGHSNQNAADIKPIYFSYHKKPVFNPANKEPSFAESNNHFMNMVNEHHNINFDDRPQHPHNFELHLNGNHHHYQNKPENNHEAPYSSPHNEAANVDEPVENSDILVNPDELDQNPDNDTNSDIETSNFLETPLNENITNVIQSEEEAVV